MTEETLSPDDAPAGEHEEDEEMSLVPVSDVEVIVPGENEEVRDESSTFRTERIKEDRFAPDDPAAGAAIVAMAVFKAYGVRDASNGANIGANLQVDAAYAVDFEELIGETTYIVKVARKDYGECRVTSVTSKADADNRAQTVVGLKWSQDQRKKTKDIVEIVGQSIRIELWTVDLPIIGAKAE